MKKKFLMIGFFILNGCNINPPDTISHEKINDYKIECSNEANIGILTNYCFNKLDFTYYFYDKNLSDYYFVDELKFKNLIHDKYKKSDSKSGLIFLAIDKNKNLLKKNTYIYHNYLELKNDKNSIEINDGLYKINTQILYSKNEKKIDINFLDYRKNFKYNTIFTYNNLEKNWKTIYNDDDKIIYVNLIDNLDYCGEKKYNPFCEKDIKVK